GAGALPPPAGLSPKQPQQRVPRQARAGCLRQLPLLSPGCLPAAVLHRRDRPSPRPAPRPRSRAAVQTSAWTSGVVPAFRNVGATAGRFDALAYPDDAPEPSTQSISLV